MSDETYDVVIVGGGGAGLAAAVEATGCGARVLVLEKSPRLQGTTGLAIGSITASCTNMQRRAGILDSPAEHLEDYLRMAGALASRDNPQLAFMLTENVGETVDWLQQQGVEFFGPMQEPPHRKPRMHNVLPSARSFIFHLSRRARAGGAEIRLQTPARQLMREGTRVTGVTAQGPDGSEQRIYVRRGVILAGGDFANGAELRREFFGDRSANYPAVNPFATGDCQHMAREIGGVICNGDLFEPQLRFVPPSGESLLLKIPPYRLFTRPIKWALDHFPGWMIRPFALSFVTTYLAPDRRLFGSGALLVDRSGNRAMVAGALLVDRSGNRAMVAGAPLDSGTARDEKTDTYVVFDAVLYRKFSAYPYYIATAPNVAFAYIDDFRRNRRDIYFEAPDLNTLAAKLGIPADTLRQTVASHNETAAAPSCAGSTHSQPLLKPPFVALGPIRAYILTTHGGLRVSTKLEVLDWEGRPIPRLFAAGAAGRGGLLLPGHGHSLGWAFTSGRIAGRHAARMAPLMI